MPKVSHTACFLEHGDRFNVEAKDHGEHVKVIVLRVGDMDLSFHIPRGADLADYMAQLHAATAPQPEEVAA